MAYLTPADFRTATLNEVCQGLALAAGAPDNVSDAFLTAAIARLTVRLDELTNDHFESQSLTIDLTGDGTSTLTLPIRCTAVSQVRTLDPLGNYTTQLATSYRLVSSLDAAGATRVIQQADDYLDIPTGQFLSLYWGAGRRWPAEANGVRVIGTFGWTVTPPDIKRALALMVFDHFKPLGQTLRRATQYQTSDAVYSFGAGDEDHPTGLWEVDEIVKDYLREPVLVG